MRAAGKILDQLPLVQGAYTDLAAVVDDSLPRLRGQSIQSLAATLEAWFTAAVPVPGELAGYAENLVTVDQTVASADDAASTMLAQAPASGLNMT